MPIDVKQPLENDYYAAPDHCTKQMGITELLNASRCSGLLS